MRSLAHLAFPLLVLRAWLVLSSPSPGSESMPYPLTVTALGTDGEKPIGAATELVVWPGVAAGYRAGRDPISNAERLKRYVLIHPRYGSGALSPWAEVSRST